MLVRTQDSSYLPLQILEGRSDGSEFPAATHMDGLVWFFLALPDWLLWLLGSEPTDGNLPLLMSSALPLPPPHASKNTKQVLFKNNAMKDLQKVNGKCTFACISKFSI